MKVKTTLPVPELADRECKIERERVTHQHTHTLHIQILHPAFERPASPPSRVAFYSPS